MLVIFRGAISPSNPVVLFVETDGELYKAMPKVVLRAMCNVFEANSKKAQALPGLYTEFEIDKAFKHAEYHFRIKDKKVKNVTMYKLLFSRVDGQQQANLAHERQRWMMNPGFMWNHFELYI